MTRKLTSRQQIVLQLTAEGYNILNIAMKLNRCEQTIKRRREQICYRLGAMNITQAVAIAARHRMLDLGRCEGVYE